METFEVKNGKITLSDPCYDLSTTCMIKDVKFPNGIYRVDIREYDSPSWGKRVAELIIYNINKVPENEGKEMDILWKEIEGEVGVDSGQAGIYDAIYYELHHSENDIDEDWYDEICDLTYGKKHYGTKDDSCVVSSSGFGDGGYQAFLGYLGEEIVGAKIEFIPEDYDEDVEDDEFADYEEEF